MISLIFGSDSYQSNVSLQKIINEHKKHFSDLNIIVIDGEKINELHSLQIECQTVAFLAEKKMIVIHNMLSKNKRNTLKTEYINFLKSLDIGNDNNLHIIHYENTAEIDKRQTLYKYFKKEGNITEFKQKKGSQTHDSIRKYLEKNKISISQEALEYIAPSEMEINFWELHQTLNKITLFAKAKSLKNLHEKDMAAIIEPHIRLKIFDLTDKISKQNTIDALEILKTLFEKRENEFLILGSIAYQMRVLLTIKVLQESEKNIEDIIRLSKLHPFVVHKNKKQAEMYNIKQLQNFYKKILEIEYKAKTRDTDIQYLLTDFIIESQIK